MASLVLSAPGVTWVKENVLVWEAYCQNGTLPAGADRARPRLYQEPIPIDLLVLYFSVLGKPSKYVEGDSDLGENAVGTQR